MTDPLKPEDELEAIAKQYFDSDKMNNYKSSEPIIIIPAEKYQIISFDLKPGQDSSPEFCNMIALAACMFYKMEKQEAAQRKAQIEYRAAYNRSMN